MWDVILGILSVVGTILLILLLLSVAAVLLVLFYPITYRVRGQRMPEDTWITAKANWLFGLVRVRYAYPEPGKVTVRFLWKTLYDSEEQPEEPLPKRKTENTKQEKRAAVEEKAESEGQTAEQESSEQENSINSGEETDSRQTAEEEKTEKKGILGKISKIKYTIQKIYDKIKEIWENLSYYKALMQEDNTVALWSHVKLRIFKVLKNIRPRHIRADILFGTGAPDTTGYAFGIYGMLSPILGRKVNVTPDFTQAVLEGRVDISGHISLSVLIWNALRLGFDKKLHLFIKKLKREPKQVRA